MVIVLQNTHDTLPIAREGELWGVFREIKTCSTDHFRHYVVVSSNVLYLIVL